MDQKHALDNVREVNDEATAVAIAIRTANDKYAKDYGPGSYNLDKKGGKPFSEVTVLGLLGAAMPAYTQYVSLRVLVDDAAKEDKWGVEAIWLRLNRPSPNAAAILNDFVSRARENIVDQRFRDAHLRYAGPVAHLLGSGFVKVQRAADVADDDFPPKSPAAFAKNDRVALVQIPDKQMCAQVIKAFTDYAANYFPPLSLETANPGQYAVHEAHLVDPTNPHRFRHVHVWNANGAFKTTLRLGTDQ